MGGPTSSIFSTDEQVIKDYKGGTLTADSPSPDTEAAACLPAGYHCAVTWGIPDDFGSMTEAMLSRSRTFSSQCGRSVDILTFEYKSNYKIVRDQLVADKKLIDGVLLRNIWEELPRLSRGQLLAGRESMRIKGGHAPLGQGDNFESDMSSGVETRRIRYSSDGETVLQVDYLRPDGSLVVSDLRDPVVRGSAGGRLVTLCDEAGLPIVSWDNIWSLYLFWLDSVVGSRETYMIIDSKTAAKFMTRYRRDNVVTMHVVHSPHRVRGAKHGRGAISPDRKYVFNRLASFDAVVFLTEQQKQDADGDCSAPGNTCVVPNSFPLFSAPADLGAVVRGHGVIFTDINKTSRLEDAIRAVALARETGSDEVTLTVYGSGPDLQRLQDLARSEGTADAIRFARYDNSSRDSCMSAAFTLLTATRENQGRPLVEGMSFGCVPISYDVAYGPSDLISDGWNGYLVPEGDFVSLAKRISHLFSMNPEQLQIMRERAVEKAAEFSDAAIIARWTTEMSSAVERKLLALSS